MYSHLTPLCYWTLKEAESKLLILLKISYTVMRSQTLLLKMDCIWTVGLCVNVWRVCKGRCIKLLPYILLIRCFVGSALRKCKQLAGMVFILVDICKLSSPDSDLFTNLAHSFLPRRPVSIIRSKDFFLFFFNQSQQYFSKPNIDFNSWLQ